MSAYAQDGPRVALVIGNSAYQHTTPLANPVNDAADVASSLEALGFQVQIETNCTNAQMERAVRRFVDTVTRTGVEAALFYYAGHGVQYEGVNYLLPVNADIRDGYELLDRALSMDRVTEGLHVRVPGSTSSCWTPAAITPLPPRAALPGGLRS